MDFDHVAIVQADIIMPTSGLVVIEHGPQKDKTNNRSEGYSFNLTSGHNTFRQHNHRDNQQWQQYD